ncbi:hypothetical protein RT717_19485 [Imperialibacter roseus]|uniref:Outer membrane protein beta-barrel domain-containing protein n=1 Tax=Imperialibacter roseus TaxID=1324217 RepID=A0ABZ0IKS8_9BACT|nr:hypothetical protein [Imperialibacter roseus]WOK05266.1 hypothetical protein RT717_19485 [Imperialibacter roseus]
MNPRWLKHPAVCLTKTGIFIFLSTSCLAQSPDSAKSLIRFSGSYSFSHLDRSEQLAIDENAFTYYGINNTSYSLSLAFIRRIKGNFWLGAGISYRSLNSVYNPSKDVPEVSCRGYCTISSYTYSKTRDWALSPEITALYSLRLHKNISFIGSMFSRYEFGDVASFSERRWQKYADGYTPPNLGTIHDNGIPYGEVTGGSFDYPREYQKIIVGISPGLRFNFAKKLGVDLGLGGIQYGRKIKDARTSDITNKSQEWQINFNPRRWSIGVWYAL